MLLKCFDHFVHRTGPHGLAKSLIRGCAQGQATRGSQEISDASINVIGSGSPGDPTSFLLRTGLQCHLFNCGEGTDRIARCSRMLRWAAVQNVFLTSIDWSRIGGLLAVMNEVLKNGSSRNFTIHGPEKLRPIVERMRSIINLPKSSLKFNSTESYVARGLRIDLLPLSSDADIVVYMCKVDAHRGRLNLEKCVDLNVPVELMNRLRNESIELPDGRLITPNDVLDGVDDEKNVLVVDIPSPKYLHCLEHHEAFNTFLNTSKELEVVVHFSPPHIFDSSGYGRFLGRTMAHRHLVLNENNKYSGLFDVHRRQAQCHQLNHEIFPLLSSSVDANPTLFDAKDVGDGTIHYVSTRTKYILRNRGRIEYEMAADVEEDMAEESGSEIPVPIDDGGNTVNRVNRYPKIVFLGTSSQSSGPIRNVSSILVHTSETSCILLDCGEGTCGQIIRFYGPKANEVLAKIKAIFISHLHGDHHYGLFGMLLQRKQLGLSNRPPILLMFPCENYADWIKFCSRHIEDVADEFQFVDNSDLLTPFFVDDILARLDVSSLRTCAVDHIKSSFGISATIPGCNGNAPFKLTYSGDTMPCDSLVKLGQNSTLLIHEATFENALLERAQRTNHSTIAQAIEQSAKMNAKYTILTHFSQRYVCLPWIEGDLNTNVGIAFDNMEIVEDDLSKLSALHGPMKTMFANHLKNVEENATRNKVRQMYKDQEKEY